MYPSISLKVLSNLYKFSDKFNVTSCNIFVPAVRSFKFSFRYFNSFWVNIINPVKCHYIVVVLTCAMFFSYSHGVSSPGRHVRTRLYFTSESHVHSLLTVLRYGGLLDVSYVLSLFFCLWN